MNELFVVDIHLTKVIVQVVQVLVIQELLRTSNCRNNHYHELQTCAH